MISSTNQDAKNRMTKVIDSLKLELAKLRTGRAHPSLLEHLMVNYYGTSTPLSQVANVAIENSRMLTVTPWEKNLVPEIEKAIITANLGLNPATAGTVIRIPMPPLTESGAGVFVLGPMFTPLSKSEVNVSSPVPFGVSVRS